MADDCKEQGGWYCAPARASQAVCLSCRSSLGKKRRVRRAAWEEREGKLPGGDGQEMLLQEVAAVDAAGTWMRACVRAGGRRPSRSEMGC